MDIKVILVDVGGVLLTNGWDTEQRGAACEHFGLDPIDMQKRHEIIFDDFECGRCSFDEYLKVTVFYVERPFTMQQFKEYVFAGSKPYPKAIEHIKELKKQHNAKLAVLSNEGREIAEYRFKTFNFLSFVDYFIVSSFVGYRKPDPRIYKLALDLSQEKPSNILYIDDREGYFQTAKALGLNTKLIQSANS